MYITIKYPRAASIADHIIFFRFLVSIVQDTGRFLEWVVLHTGQWNMIKRPEIIRTNFIVKIIPVASCSNKFTILTQSTHLLFQKNWGAFHCRGEISVFSRLRSPYLKEIEIFSGKLTAFLSPFEVEEYRITYWRTSPQFPANCWSQRIVGTRFRSIPSISCVPRNYPVLAWRSPFSRIVVTAVLNYFWCVDRRCHWLLVFCARYQPCGWYHCSHGTITRVTETSILRRSDRFESIKNS